MVTHQSKWHGQPLQDVNGEVSGSLADEVLGHVEASGAGTHHADAVLLPTVLNRGDWRHPVDDG